MNDNDDGDEGEGTKVWIITHLHYMFAVNHKTGVSRRGGIRMSNES